jgi:hypothetical protein
MDYDIKNFIDGIAFARGTSDDFKIEKLRHLIRLSEATLRTIEDRVARQRFDTTL